MTLEKMHEEIAKYNWYHRIEIAPGVFTPGIKDYVRICDFIHENQRKHDYTGKSVLDVGARDCLHAIRVKRLGAGRVLAIDNDISPGARDFVLPLLGLDIEYKHQNLFSLDDSETFDIVQCFGVLYHLRYPFNGLKKLVDAAKVGGTILIEGGFLVDDRFADMEMLYCPSSENSPYDPSSVTFFNARGISAAMKSFGCRLETEPLYLETRGNIRRGFFVFRKAEQVTHGYWEGLHTYHTRAAHARTDWQADQ